MKCTVGGFFLKVPEVSLFIARAFPCYTKLYLLRCFSAVSEIRIITLYLALHGLNTPLALERVMGEKEGSEVEPVMQNFHLQVCPQVP